MPETSTELLIISQPKSTLLNTLLQDNSSLSDLINLHEQFKAGKLASSYQVKDGILFFQNKYYIGLHSTLRSILLQEFHVTPMAGHSGVKRTLMRISTNFYWPNLRKSVVQFIASCLICQQTKYSTQPPSGLLQPLPILNLVWEEITMDFITDLPPSRGYTTILVVVDRLTKSAHFGPLPSCFTAYKTAELFADIVVKIHGFPSTIVSDRDPIFISHFWKKLFELSGTLLHHSTAYHPQTDGQSEVVNRGLEQYLRAFCHDTPTAWVKFLGWAKFCYNTSYHSSLKMSPFQALFGRLPPIIPPYISGSTSIQSLDELLTEREHMLKSLQENLTIAQHRMQQKANAHRKELQLAVGDTVLLRLQPYRQLSIARRHSQKLAKRYYGPFKILERIGPVAYRLQLPPTSKIHPVFHISNLKPYSASATLELNDFPDNIVANRPLSSPIAICAGRNILKQGKLQRQVLVQGSHCAPENATWEDYEQFCQQYPSFHLADKVHFEDAGNDTSQTNQAQGDTTEEQSLDQNQMNQAQEDIAKEQSLEQQKISAEAEYEEDQQVEVDPAKNKRLRKPPHWLKDYN